MPAIAERSPMVKHDMPGDLVEALKSLNTKSIRRAMAKGDRNAIKKKLQLAIGRIAKTAPSSSWADWIGSKGNVANWPPKGMLLNQAIITYLEQSSRRFTPAMCADIEDRLDLMTPKQADRYDYPSSHGCVVGIHEISDSYDRT